jgi:hypothetical protein
LLLLDEDSLEEATTLLLGSSFRPDFSEGSFTGAFVGSFAGTFVGSFAGTFAGSFAGAVLNSIEFAP